VEEEVTRDAVGQEGEMKSSKDLVVVVRRVLALTCLSHPSWKSF